ncbi:MAG: hypothetical protein ACREOF_03750 [Gemmatimonadales bacterium]
MSRSFRERVPWWAKLGAKVVLSRLPFSYRRWRSIGIFRHGRMLDPTYAHAVFERHFRHVRGSVRPGFATLELGPGDSLATAFLAAAEGAGTVWLVDTGPFAEMALDPYRPLLASLGSPAPANGVGSLGSLLAAANARYLTTGLAALRALPSDAAELIFSQAVLEHVSRDEFEPTIRELFRIQAPGGVSSHRIDLRDHLQDGLNSLRFSRERWESRLFARSGFYTNRLRASEVAEIFSCAGFRIRELVADRWPAPPLPRARLHPEFARFDDEELRVHGIDLVAEKPA